MKVFLHKITSLFLSLLVLGSSLSFTVDMHFCGDTLVDLGWFEDAETCGMDGDLMAAMGCCEDLELVAEGQDVFKMIWEQPALDAPAVFVAVSYSLLQPPAAIQTDFTAYRDYHPPPLIRDIVLLDETFLI